jgi:hypothetical protein
VVDVDGGLLTERWCSCDRPRRGIDSQEVAE